jgi:hypothetical protein
MTPPAISERLRAFLHDRFTSIEQIDALLLLCRSSPREWPIAAVGRDLRADQLSAARWLVGLERAGLISARNAAGVLYYWYEGAEDPIVRELERLDRERRGVLVAELAAAARGDLLGFADAFRWRAHDENQGRR